ncbi:MAG: cysteine hydrolase family protein [bacterium]
MPQFLKETELDESLPKWMEAVRDFKARFRSLDVERSALLVIDMQNDFLLENGALPAWGGPAIIPRLQRLIKSYRSVNRPIIYTRHCYFNPEIDGGTTAEWWGMDRDSTVLHASLPGSEIHTELAPLSSDLVLTKQRYSAFQNTNLESVLRQFQVRDVVISGVTSNCCCEATAHEALFRDFHVFFLADGCGGTNEATHIASLRDIACFYGTVLTCEELISQIRIPHQHG